MASRPGHDFWLRIARDAFNAPPSEQGVETHTGPFRLQWAYYRYEPENSIVHETELIYPLDWIHFTEWADGSKFRDDRNRLARELRNKTPAEMAEHFPNSYCVTFWTHNW
jgi:hypothetical protein